MLKWIKSLFVKQKNKEWISGGCEKCDELLMKIDLTHGSMLALMRSNLFKHIKSKHEATIS